MKYIKPNTKCHTLSMNANLCDASITTMGSTLTGENNISDGKKNNWEELGDDEW